MKKIIVILSILLIMTGCGKLSNTPTKRVEELFDNYKMLNENVIKQLNEIVDKDERFNASQKELYKDIMKKQYNNLMYEIKDEYINGDDAIVTVQITVKDFNKVLKDTDVYYEAHKEEFKDANGEYQEKYVDYLLDKMKDAKESVSYTLKLNLIKKDKKWELEELSSSDIDKINGIYSY